MSQLSRKGWVRCTLAATCIATGFLPAALQAQEPSALSPRYLSPPPPGSGSSVVPYPQSGYEGPLVLRLPASARMLGMANAGVSSSDGDALFYSPGMLTQARGAAMSIQRYGANATAGSFASVQTLGSLSVGIGAQFLRFSTNPTDWVGEAEQGAARLSDGGSEGASSTAFTLGLGRVVKGIRMGAAVKYAEERLGSVTDGVVAFDLGMSKALGPATLAVAVQNMGAGPDMYFVNGPLPTRLTVGFGGGLFPIWEKWDIGMQSQVSVERDGFVRPAGGVELGYVPVEGVAFVVRSGLRLPREPDEPLATAGLGITADRYSVDWAIEPMRGGRPVVHRLGLRIR
jgi:hypothetical protein